MSTPTATPFSPSPSTSPKGVDQLARVAGKPSHENDYFSSSEANEKPGSEAISEQPKKAVVSVVFDSSTPTFASDSNDNARDTGLVSRAVVPVVFGSEATENDQNDSSSTTPATTPEALRLLALVGTDDDPYQDGGPWAYANDPGGRVFMITQNLEHPATGQTLITTEQVEKALAKKGVKRYAWILHDKDVYTAAEIAKNPALVQGSPKSPHVHVVIQRSSFASIAQVARAFGVPPQCVESKPPSSFLDLVEYLTHENSKQQQAGKHLYEDSEVQATPHWDWRSELEAHKEARQEKALSKNLRKRRDEAALKISLGEWTPDYVRERDRELWTAPGVMKHLQAMRYDWLVHQTPPGQVLNFYICGEGGVGKDLLAAALARSLNPGAEKPYFTIGGENVSFEHYDGEEIVIWEDFRPYSMIETCRKDRGLLFRILGPYRDSAKKIIVNVKGSDTQLINRVNIVTGPESYTTFLDGLAGEYDQFVRETGLMVRRTSENKSQAYRRFPVIIPVTEGEFSIYVNKGFLEGTREYFQYEKHEHLRQSLEQLTRRCELIEDRARADQIYNEISAQTVVPVVEQHARLTGANRKHIAPEVVLAEFTQEGQVVVPPEPTPEEIAAQKQREADEQAHVAEQLRKARMEEERQAAEIKAAEDRRKAAELARKQREQEVIDAKKAELAAAGEIRLLSSVQVKWVNDEPRAVVPSSSSPEQTSPWQI